MKVFRKLGWFFSREWRSYTVGVIMLILVALMELVPPQVIGWVIDGITQETLTGNRLLQFILLLIAVAVLTYIVRYFWRIMIFGASIGSAGFQVPPLPEVFRDEPRILSKTPDR